MGASLSDSNWPRHPTELHQRWRHANLSERGRQTWTQQWQARRQGGQRGQPNSGNLNARAQSQQAIRDLYGDRWQDAQSWSIRGRATRRRAIGVPIWFTQVRGQTRVQTRGQTGGQTRGQTSGQTRGQTRGRARGQTMGHARGQVRGVSGQRRQQNARNPRSGLSREQARLELQAAERELIRNRLAMFSDMGRNLQGADENASNVNIRYQPGPPLYYPQTNRQNNISAMNPSMEERRQREIPQNFRPVAPRPEETTTRRNVETEHIRNGLGSSFNNMGRNLQETDGNLLNVNIGPQHTQTLNCPETNYEYFLQLRNAEEISRIQNNNGYISATHPSMEVDQQEPNLRHLTRMTANLQQPVYRFRQVGNPNRILQLYSVGETPSHVPAVAQPEDNQRHLRPAFILMANTSQQREINLTANLGLSPPPVPNFPRTGNSLDNILQLRGVEETPPSVPNVAQPEENQRHLRPVFIRMANTSQQRERNLTANLGLSPPPVPNFPRTGNSLDNILQLRGVEETPPSVPNVAQPEVNQRHLRRAFIRMANTSQQRERNLTANLGLSPPPVPNFPRTGNSLDNILQLRGVEETPPSVPNVAQPEVNQRHLRRAFIRMANTSQQRERNLTANLGLSPPPVPNFPRTGNSLDNILQLRGVEETPPSVPNVAQPEENQRHLRPVFIRMANTSQQRERNLTANLGLSPPPVPNFPRTGNSLDNILQLRGVEETPPSVPNVAQPEVNQRHLRPAFILMANTSQQRERNLTANLGLSPPPVPNFPRTGNSLDNILQLRGVEETPPSVPNVAQPEENQRHLRPVFIRMANTSQQRERNLTANLGLSPPPVPNFPRTGNSLDNILQLRGVEETPPSVPNVAQPEVNQRHLRPAFILMANTSQQRERNLTANLGLSPPPVPNFPRTGNSLDNILQLRGVEETPPSVPNVAQTEDNIRHLRPAFTRMADTLQQERNGTHENLGLSPPPIPNFSRPGNSSQNIFQLRGVEETPRSVPNVTPTRLNSKQVAHLMRQGRTNIQVNKNESLPPLRPLTNVAQPEDNERHLRPAFTRMTANLQQREETITHANLGLSPPPVPKAGCSSQNILPVRGEEETPRPLPSVAPTRLNMSQLRQLMERIRAQERVVNNNETLPPLRPLTNGMERIRTQEGDVNNTESLPPLRPLTNGREQIRTQERHVDNNESLPPLRLLTNDGHANLSENVTYRMPVSRSPPDSILGAYVNNHHDFFELDGQEALVESVHTNDSLSSSLHLSVEDDFEGYIRYRTSPPCNIIDVIENSNPRFFDLENEDILSPSVHIDNPSPPVDPVIEDNNDDDQMFRTPSPSDLLGVIEDSNPRFFNLEDHEILAPSVHIDDPAPPVDPLMEGSNDDDQMFRTPSPSDLLGVIEDSNPRFFDLEDHEILAPSVHIDDPAPPVDPLMEGFERSNRSNSPEHNNSSP